MLRRSLSHPSNEEQSSAVHLSDVFFADPHCPIARYAADLLPQLLCLSLHGSIAAASGHRCPDILQLPGGLQVAVAIDGRVTYAAAFGYANAETRSPLTLWHQMKAASQSKVLTALLALRLCEQRIGGLNLDEPIWGFLCRTREGQSRESGWRLPPNHCGPIDDPQCWIREADRISLRHLLSHTSGLNVRGFPQHPLRTLFGPCVPPACRTLMDGNLGEEWTPRLEQEPGGANSVLYSGAGYTLIQMVIEHATGLSFADAAERYLLRPAELVHTTFRPGGGEWKENEHREKGRFARLLQSHPPNVNGHNPPGQALPHMFYAATAPSGAYSNAIDLAALFSAVARDAKDAYDAPAITASSGVFAPLPRILSRSMATASLTPTSPPANRLAFGLGFAISRWKDGSPAMLIHKHAGWGSGFWCMTEGFVELNAAVSVQCNIEEPLGKRISQMVLSTLMERIWAARETLGHAPVHSAETANAH